MKLKFLMIVAVAGMAIAGCSASKSTEGSTDSMMKDSSTMMRDTTKKMDTTKTMPADTTKM